MCLGLVLLLPSLAGADYESGMEAFNKGNYATAYSEFKKEAKKGNADAQYALGILYASGKGVARDYKEAVKWYTKGAQQGHTHSQYSVGAMYASGRGVPEDYVEAHMWFNIAAALGHKKSSELRNKLTDHMTSDQIAESNKLAREWLKKHGK